MTDPWLTTADAAGQIGLAEGTLRQWRHKGIGPKGVKLGGQNVRYRQSEIDRWLAEQEDLEDQRRQAA